MISGRKKERFVFGSVGLRDLRNVTVFFNFFVGCCDLSSVLVLILCR